MRASYLNLCLVICSLCYSWPMFASEVAEGYADWTGVEPKNRIFGRVLSASDFRQRVTVFLLLPCDENDEAGKKLGDMLRGTRALTSVQSSPGGTTFNWDMEEQIPRGSLLVVLLHGKCTPKMLKNAMAPRQGENASTNPAKGWIWASFYSNVEMANGPDPEGRYPYVYVMGPNGTKALWEGVYEKGAWKKISATVSKAKKQMGGWTPLTGVAEPQYFKTEQKDLLAGKPALDVLARLKKCFGDTNVEKAKEAQIMYDAVLQYRSDLMFRISREHGLCAARAVVDMQRLVALFPQEKKNLQSIDSKLKSNKSALAMSKMLEKILEWNRPDFTFKSASEAKKAVQLANTWRKPLERLSNDKASVAISGEAALILAQVDVLADVLMTKVR